MITIKNEHITASFVTLGAELKSFVYKGTEYIWPGSENSWKGSAPILFPICSGLKDDTYYLDGKKYQLQKHGYARFCDFQVESHRDDSVTFLLKSDEESKKVYPFDYELRIIYTLGENSLNVDYEVKNLSDDTMYFSIGAHEGYLCPEGIEEYDIILPEKETLHTSVLNGNVLSDKKELVIENSDKIQLKYEYFKVDALVFKDIKARSVVLQNKSSSRSIKVNFDGFDYLLLWTIPNENYICIEPWCGITDSFDTDQDFKTKEGIQKVDENSTFVCSHSFEILG
ncbi:MAG: aldose 1-epimerase family protein [Clostridia bacterium]|nr:aldose 1-epimerase family protein [Clostridia bacterium]